MAASSNETFSGAMEVLIKQIALMKTLPDVDLQFVQGLEDMVLGRIRSPEHQMAKAGLLPGAGQNPMGAGALGLPMGGGMSAPPSQMMGAGGGMPSGLATAPPPANPDELRRILTAAGQ